MNATHSIDWGPLLAEFRKSEPQLAVDAKTLGRMLVLSERTIWRMNSDGRLPSPIRLGDGTVRWALDGPNGIRPWLAAGAPERAK